MSELLVQHDVTCPTCWETITVLFDLTLEDQTVVEDCQVCCNPMTIRFRAENGELVNVEVSAD